MASCIMPVQAVTLIEGYMLLRQALMYCVKLLPSDYQYNLVEKFRPGQSLRHWDNQQSTTVHVGLREFYVSRLWG